MTDEQIKLLGTMSDSSVSKLIGMKSCTVRRRRMALGIPNYDPFAELRAPEVEAAIGTMSDTDLYQKFNLSCSRSTVTGYRINHLKRPAYNCSEKMTLTEAHIALLGTDTDVNIGKRIGIGRDTVCVWRLKLGIPKHKRCGQENIRWEHEEEVLLGTDQDEVIAEKIGRSAEAVGMRRRKLGIPALRSKGHGKRHVATEVPVPVTPRDLSGCRKTKAVADPDS